MKWIITLVLIASLGVAFGQKKSEVKKSDTLKIELSQWERDQFTNFPKSEQRKQELQREVQALQKEFDLLMEKDRMTWGAVYNAHKINPAMVSQIIKVDLEKGIVLYVLKE